MIKILDQKFWSHGTPLGSTGVLFARALRIFFSPPQFLGSLKGPETPPGGRLLGEFNFYWPSLQPPVLMSEKLGFLKVFSLHPAY